MKKYGLYLAGLIAVIAVYIALSQNSEGRYSIYQKKCSKQGNYCIESRIYKGNSPELYLNGKQLTNSEMGIEYTPYVNDKGQYAYALYDDGSMSESVVYFNKSEICRGHYGRILDLTEEFLLFSMIVSSEDRSDIYLYSITEDKLEEIITFPEEYPHKGFLENGEAVYLELWNSDLQRTTVVYLNKKEEK